MFVDREGSDDEAVPHFLRSSRFRSPSVSFEARKAVSPGRVKIHRDLMKRQSKHYCELEQLVTALEALDKWRNKEASYLRLDPEIQQVMVRRSQRPSAKEKHPRSRPESKPSMQQALQKALDVLKAGMEPILEPGFLTKACTSEFPFLNKLARFFSTYLRTIVVASVIRETSFSNILVRW